ncbi:TRAP transporter small permease [Mangrovicoccus ximenensis]|uniref:TRAP transporter small permease n=1 Tax=Mangrovicoccus ximenensis TaxID=1911570 RepID=UPI000D3CBD1D|nr:TRAP transporter small permease [Mangrovicoccus ximenensis]
MQAIERILTLSAKLLVWLSGAFLLAMAVHVCLDVGMKYFLNKPIPGTAEIVARYYMLAAVFLPLAFVEARNTGISVDLFYGMFGPRLRRACVVLAFIGQLAFFSLLTWQSFHDAMKAMAKNEYIDGQITVYTWPATFMLPAGLGFAAAISLLRLVQALTRDDWEEVTTFARPMAGHTEVKEPV